MAERAVAPRFPIVAWLERRSRRQVIIGSFVVGLLLLALLARLVAVELLDHWWYSVATDAPVWRARFVARLELVLGALLIAGAVLGTSVVVVLSAGRRTLAPNNRAMRWYHARMGSAHRWLVVAVGVWVTWRIVSAAPASWQAWLLYTHGGDLGRSVPGTGGDLGQYLFALPFEQVVSSFVRQLLAFAFLFALVGHSVSGALRWSRSLRSRRAATAHLAVLAALLLLAQAVHAVRVARPSLALNTSGGFTGAGYTERTVTSPALWVAAAAALLAAGTLAWGVWKRQWKPSVVGISVFVVVQLVGVMVVPAIVERVVVAPARGERQLPALALNLEATRAAFGLDAVRTAEATVDDGITAEPTELASSALRTTPLFDPAAIAPALQVLEGTPGTRITQVDLDRYEVDGERRPMMVAVRSADRAGLPENGWVQDHLVYTHGDGGVVVPADQVDANGRPDVTAQLDTDANDVPVYFGENLDGWWSIVGTKRQEVGGIEYAGSQGVSLGSFFRRLVASAALGDAQISLSDELTDGSQLLLRRGLRDRLTTLAPFLSWDSDPYAVMAGDRLLWVVDGYTTAATYPYAQFYGNSGLTSNADLSSATLNYAHHAVRAVVDAADGSTTLYRTGADGDDPILDEWLSILPGLVAPADELPEELTGHLRYPKDLFVVQSTLLGKYHVEDAETLFNGSQQWVISPAAASSVGDTTSAPVAPVFSFTAADGGLRWSMTRTYNRGSAGNPGATRDELAAMIVADNDQPDRLTLTRLTSSGAPLSSPRVAQGAILSDPDLARTITLLNANGSKVTFGPFTPSIVDGGLIWLRSLVVVGTADASVPRLQSLLAVNFGLAGSGPTGDEAVRQTLPGG